MIVTDPKEVMKVYEYGYYGFANSSLCCENRYQWAASEIFDLVTYDGYVDEIFVRKIIEVCKVIHEKRTSEYIEDEENYLIYMLVCQLLYRKDWIAWGSSIRGAWFDCCNKSEDIYHTTGYVKSKQEEWTVKFSEENLMELIEFIEKEEKE